MPPYSECRVAEIDAPPQACFDALTDYERLPEWQRAVRAARVLERDDQGRGTVVEYEVDAQVKRVHYRLRQVYDEPHRLGQRVPRRRLPRLRRRVALLRARLAEPAPAPNSTSGSTRACSCPARCAARSPTP